MIIIIIILIRILITIIIVIVIIIIMIIIIIIIIIVIVIVIIITIINTYSQPNVGTFSAGTQRHSRHPLTVGGTPAQQCLLVQPLPSCSGNSTLNSVRSWLASVPNKPTTVYIARRNSI